MKKIKLLPVQVENLQKQYAETFLRLQRINVDASTSLEDIKAASGKELNLGLDASLLGSLSVTARDYADAKKILENHEVIEPNNSDIIGLGSTFVLDMNYSGIEATEVLTLVEVRNSRDDENFISISSPLGRAVNGKKEGDAISYIVDNRNITGKVTEIIKEHKKTL